jgi:hypothetical protein
MLRHCFLRRQKNRKGTRLVKGKGCHSLPKRFDELNPFAVLLHLFLYPADADRPADNDDFAAQEEMVHGVQRVNRAGTPHGSHRSADLVGGFKWKVVFFLLSSKKTAYLLAELFRVLEH